LNAAVSGIHGETSDSGAEFADNLNSYVLKYVLPVKENAMVVSVVRDEDYGIFKIVKSSALLPGGAVLVVGSAQSGCQIAEDLIENARQLYLSTSMVARLPRRYRGKE
jgi:hypothetical protein